MSEIFLASKYNRNDFVSFLSQKFLPIDFEQSQSKIFIEKPDGKINNAVKLGSCPSLELSVYEFMHNSGHDPRVTLSRESFSILDKNDTEPNALAVFFNEENAQWRLSLITSDFTLGKKKGRIKRDFSNPRRFSYLLGENCQLHTPESMLYKDYRVKSEEDLISRFAIEVVTKQFYKDLFMWYDTWAVNLVKFPTGIGAAAGLPKKTDIEKNRQHLIRLITRLIFVWFLKQKDNLVPSWIFDEKEIAKILSKFNAHSEKQGNYYNAVIQNLFFGTLNKPIKERAFANRDEAHRREDYNINTKFRDFNDRSFFVDDYSPVRYPKKFIELFSSIPFLNGGLFECLDNFDSKEYVDGFSREEKRAAFVPNCLFWGDKDHEGLIPLLKRYNFTIEENTPQDIDIALDPELLGKVFENLLGTYNEETSKTARNESGSFYTPREIVDYMVDASLKEYFKGKLNSKENNVDEKLNKLFSYHETDHDFNPDEAKIIMDAINNCKILDPACGSGAFPMGVLNKLAFIMQKLDPNNDIWREIQIKEVTTETKKAYGLEDRGKRNKRLTEIQEVFDMSTGEYSNYARKLFLIENCIYGVDIQPIAIQISKLRFFISLIVDQKTGGNINNNYNVLPLPNLETKFVAANTLIGVKQDKGFLADPEIEKKQDELLGVRHSHFSAREAKEKIRLRKRDEVLCKELSELLRKDGFYTLSDAEQLANWNPYNQTKPADFFDPYWMFGVKSGFSVVIGNPPYKQIRRGIISSHLFPYSEGKDIGKQNLYKVFVEATYNLTKNSGCCCLIVQSSLLCDISSKFTRELLITKNKIKEILEFPKVAPTIEGQVFNSVLQGTCIYVSTKIIPEEDHQFSISINNDRITIKSPIFVNIDQMSLIEFNPDLFCIPLVKHGEYELLKKIVKESTKFKTLIKSLNQGDLNLTTSKANFSSQKTNIKLLRGRNIAKYYIDYSVQEYVKSGYKDEIVALNSKNSYIVCQEVTGTMDKYRLHFAITNRKERFLFGHTANKILLKNLNNNVVILSLLNSKLLDWCFRKTSTNNHVCGYQIEQLPIILVDCTIIDKLILVTNETITMASQRLDIVNLVRQLDNLVYHLYELTYDEVKVIEPDFPLGKEEYERSDLINRGEK